MYLHVMWLEDMNKEPIIIEIWNNNVLVSNARTDSQENVFIDIHATETLTLHKYKLLDMTGIAYATIKS